MHRPSLQHFQTAPDTSPSSSTSPPPTEPQVGRLGRQSESLTQGRRASTWVRSTVITHSLVSVLQIRPPSHGRLLSSMIRPRPQRLPWRQFSPQRLPWQQFSSRRDSSSSALRLPWQQLIPQRLLWQQLSPLTSLVAAQPSDFPGSSSALKDFPGSRAQTFLAAAQPSKTSLEAAQPSKTSLALKDLSGSGSALKDFPGSSSALKDRHGIYPTASPKKSAAGCMQLSDHQAATHGRRRSSTGPAAAVSLVLLEAGTGHTV